MKRNLCLWFPNWPIQHVLVQQPELANRFLLLTETIRGRELVRFCCEKAWSVGVRSTMPLSEARSYCPSTPGLVVRPLAQIPHREGLEQLAIWCERYSPCVGFEDEDPPQCLLMDVTGLGPVFSGEQSLAEAIVQELSNQGFRVRVAIGDTTGMAWAAARFLTDPHPTVVLPIGQTEDLLPLPIEGLRLQSSHSERLRKLGIKTIGQVLELERSALKVRFKTELLRCLEHFTGERRELITPCRPEPVFLVRQQLEFGITDFLAVQQLGHSLLRRLVEQLQTRHLGTSLLECRLLTEDKNRQTIAIPLREASSEFRHLEELLR
ncbi:MAG: DNA polymerase Y family protein, partial [Planctomycetaceae bacterium]|nr:DNA polymerase Y family protein [Planctomycetaceae bacterium]